MGREDWGRGKCIQKNVKYTFAGEEPVFFMSKKKGEYMLSNLPKIKSSVVCDINGNLKHFVDGKHAYEDLKDEYCVEAIYVRDGTIVLELKLEKVSTDNDWKQDYHEQFGEEPSFFHT